MRRKSKFSAEELYEIYAKPLQVWDNPTASAIAKGITKPGPLPWQKEAFMWEYDWALRLANHNFMHCHTQDNLLAFGGRGGGKSLTGVVLNLFFMINFPGCETLFGAKTYGDAEEILMKYYKRILSIKEPWDHPMVAHVPNQADKDLVLSVPYVGRDSFGRETIIFRESVSHGFHFSDWERLRGKEYVYAHMEELSHLGEEITLDEISRSLRSSMSPIRMLYAATNPPKSRSHFMYDKWPELIDHMPNFTGAKPSPAVCKCQFCDICINDKESPEEWEYDENDICSNPNCKFLDLCLVLGNEPRKYKKTSTTVNFGHPSINGVPRFCPGNQPFWRVIHTQTTDNFHLPSDFVQSIKSSQDDANFRMFTLGEIIDLGVNKAFPAYSYDNNVVLHDIPVDVTKDIYWTHDHNTRPRCSEIVQEYPVEGSEDADICFIDEIVMFDTKEPVLKEEAKELLKQNPQPLTEEFISRWRIRGVGPEHVAQEFIDRYSNWNLATIEAGDQRKVVLHGDHTALNSKMSPFSKNEFQILYDMLTAAGFKVEVAVKKLANTKIQIAVSDRLAVTNWLLRDDKGRSRIKINAKKCPYLMKSLEDTIKKINDMEKIDKSCDDLAAAATNTAKVHLVTHPAEAAGYYLVRRFNLLKVPEGFKFVYVPGEPLLNFDNKGNTFYSKEDQDKEAKKAEDAKNQAQLLIDYFKQEVEDNNSFSIATLEHFRDYFS